MEAAKAGSECFEKKEEEIFFSESVLGVEITLLMVQPCVLFRILSVATPNPVPTIDLIISTTSCMELRFVAVMCAKISPFQVR